MLFAVVKTQSTAKQSDKIKKANRNPCPWDLLSSCFFLKALCSSYPSHLLAVHRCSQISKAVSWKGTTEGSVYRDRERKKPMILFHEIRQQHPSGPFLASNQKFPFHHSRWITKRANTCSQSHFPYQACLWVGGLCMQTWASEQHQVLY